jgi:hypothetical protein
MKGYLSEAILVSSSTIAYNLFLSYSEHHKNIACSKDISLFCIIKS